MFFTRVSLTLAALGVFMIGSHLVYVFYLVFDATTGVPATDALLSKPFQKVLNQDAVGLVVCAALGTLGEISRSVARGLRGQAT